jgi:acyl-coenzyme A thioesterase PaaI-like protein
MACPTRIDPDDDVPHGATALCDAPHRWTYDGCFGCGDVPGGLRMPIVTGPGRTITATWTVQPHHQGAVGLAHGGAIAAAFDEVLGAVQIHFGETAVTASLTTEFRLPVPVGSVVHLLARPEQREGRKMRVVGEARLGGPDGPVAARAEGLFVVVGEEHFARFGAAQEHTAVPLDR